jgi:hypothetical protein
VLDAGCDRWLIENLRGWLVSVPVRTADGAACAGSSADATVQPR